jgi:CheY-like chemotaxis protein
LVQKSNVLIVDRSAESREVLKTALERRGMRIFEATDVENGVKLARQHRLDLIVLDLEASNLGDEISSGDANNDRIATDATMIHRESVFRPSAGDSAVAGLNFAGNASSPPTPMVLLGVARGRNCLPGNRAEPFFAKPYHYGPLILKIEQMLGQGRGTRS